VSMRTAALCWLANWTADTAKNAAMPTAVAAKRNKFVSIMTCSFRLRQLQARAGGQ